MGATQERHARGVPGAPGDRMGKIVHGLPLGAYVVVLEHSAVACNKPRGAGPLSLLRQNVIGQTLFDVLKSFRREVVGAEFEQVLRTGRPLAMQQA